MGILEFLKEMYGELFPHPLKRVKETLFGEGEEEIPLIEVEKGSSSAAPSGYGEGSFPSYGVTPSPPSVPEIQPSTPAGGVSEPSVPSTPVSPPAERPESGPSEPVSEAPSEPSVPPPTYPPSVPSEPVRREVQKVEVSPTPQKVPVSPHGGVRPSAGVSKVSPPERSAFVISDDVS